MSLSVGKNRGLVEALQPADLGFRNSVLSVGLHPQLLDELTGQLAGRAELHDRSNFHLNAVFKSRAMSGDLDSLLFIFDNVAENSRRWPPWIRQMGHR